MGHPQKGVGEIQKEGAPRVKSSLFVYCPQSPSVAPHIRTLNSSSHLAVKDHSECSPAHFLPSLPLQVAPRRTTSFLHLRGAETPLRSQPASGSFLVCIYP